MERLGRLLETYGTYEMNGIAFQDVHEIWWLETIGGHHWMARRVPDDVLRGHAQPAGHRRALTWTMRYGDKKDYMCSADLREFIAARIISTCRWTGA